MRGGASHARAHGPRRLPTAPAVPTAAELLLQMMLERVRAALPGRLSVIRLFAPRPIQPHRPDPWARLHAWRNEYGHEANLRYALPGFKLGVGAFVVACVCEAIYSRLHRKH